MQDRAFYSSCFGFIFGILLRSLVHVDIFVVLLVAFLAGASVLIFKNKLAVLVGVFVVAFLFGVLRFDLADKVAPASLEEKVGESVSLSGLIVDEPDMRETNQKLTVLVKEQAGRIKILITAGLGEYFKYGDTINFSGKLSKSENFLTDQGKEFDYINYLRKDGIYYTMFYPKTEIVSSGGGNPIKRALFGVKERFLEKINVSIPNPESLLMGGLILGERSTFNADLRRAFVDTGTIHIVALSGYNVTIVAEWIMKLFAFLPNNFAFGAGVLGILLFVIMSGASSTAVRAGIMATLALVARATGRTYDVARILILTGVVMILFNPFILVFDVSFQLSFIATVAVIFLAPRIEKYFTWVPRRFGLQDIVAVTFAAYIFVLPFILYKMGNLSMVALPANILILPFIPITMLFGFLTGIMGLISYFLSTPFGFLSTILLKYELLVVGFFSRIPFASFTIPNFPLSITILIYAYFVYRLFGRNIKSFFKQQESSLQ